MADAAEQISALRDEVSALREVIGALEQRLERVERTAPVVDSTPDSDEGAVLNPLAEGGGIDVRKTSLLHVVEHARETYEAMRARPANLHQVSTLLCLDPNVDQATKSKYLLTSFVVVVAQLLTCRSVSGGAKFPSCASSADCPSGWRCSTLSSGGNGD